MCDALLELAKEEVEKRLKEEMQKRIKEEVQKELKEKIKIEVEVGKEIGRQEEKIAIVTKMREKGLSVEQIVELTGLPENEVQEIIKER